MVGYFAFPPTSSRVPILEETIRETDVNVPHRLKNRKNPQQHSESVDGDKEAKAQLEREAHLGETEWVRWGGWLRDSSGRMDKARLEHLRAELRLVDEERQALKRWDTYEAQWKSLLSCNAPVTFADIPWPASPLPLSPEDLDFHTIAEFILGPLCVRSNPVPLKERLRTCMLRWHPDKLSNVLLRTVEGDVESVRAGINTVFHVLKSLQDLKRGLDIPV